MNIEILLLGFIALTSLALVFLDPKKALYICVVLSLLLHKELFSVYAWNIMPIRVFMVAVFLYFLYSLAKERPRKFFSSGPFGVFLVSMLVINAVSILFSENLKASIQVLAFFSTIVALGGVLFKLNKKYEGFTAKLLNFLTFCVFLLCLVGVIQLVVFFKTGFIFGAFWKVPGHFPRLGSLFWDVNHFAGLLALLAPYAAIKAITTRKLSALYYLVAAALMSSILLITNSRTAWLSAFVAFLFFVNLLLYQKFKAKGLMAVFAVLLVLFGLGSLEYSNKSSPFRAKVKQYFHYRMDSFDSHILLLRGSLAIFEKYPILGGGYGSFYEQFSKTPISAEFYSRDPAALNTRVPAHSIWGEALGETGTLGFFTALLLYSSLLGLLIYGSLRIPEKRTKLTLSAMASSLVGILVGGVFYSYNSEFYWLVIFLYYLYALNSVKKHVFADGEINFGEVYRYFIRDRRFPPLILTLISLPLIFISLGSNHMIPYDEAIYAAISRNMVESGDYLSLFWKAGQLWFEKPPLYMWLTAGLFKILGVNELAVRLPSALFGLGTVLLVYKFAKHLYGRAAGFFAGLCLLTTFHFLYYSRIGMLDITATFFITASLYLYFRFWDGRSKLPIMLFSGALAGAAVMTKGVVGFVPLVVVFAHSIIFGRGQYKRLVIGLVVMLAGSLATFLPWHLYMYHLYGKLFITNYIGYHVLQRATVSIEDKGRPFFWYLTVLKVSMRLWFIWLIPSVLLVLARLKMFRGERAKFGLVAIWALVVFLLFSSAVSKLVWYIIPIYPALAIFCGITMAFAFHYLASKVGQSFVPKALLAVLFSFVPLAYLFMNREMVYVSDLTGSQAQLLQRKDSVFGIDEPVFADRIELPLVLFYTRGPHEIVDFGPLSNYLLLAQENKSSLIFITKESRYRKFKEIYPTIQLIEQKKEWVLAVYK